MGAGKSASLIARAHTNKSDSIVLKPTVDTRDGESIIKSRNGSSIPCRDFPNGNLKEVYQELKETLLNFVRENGYQANIVYVDEAQFLTTDQVEALLLISIQEEIIIECFGLLTNFKSHLFEGSKRLIEVADKIENLIMYSGGSVARQNARHINGQIVTEGETIVLGKEESYKAISTKEYFKNKLKEVQ